eukprot:523808-Prymnesium_polylepis.1
MRNGLLHARVKRKSLRWRTCLSGGGLRDRHFGRKVCVRSRSLFLHSRGAETLLELIRKAFGLNILSQLSRTISNLLCSSTRESRSAISAEIFLSRLG